MEGDNVVQYAVDLLGNSFPIIPLIFFTAVIVIYSIFIFFFYRYLAKKNIIGLNLRKYNRSENPGIAKFLGFVFYTLEYVILLPIMTIFWFGIMTLLLLILAKSINVQTIMIVTASLIASVRITAYISEKLSQDLAKMLPFTILALAITGENFFSMERFVTRIAEIPAVLNALPQFIIFIIVVELVLRTIELIKKFLTYGDEINEEIEIEE